jgi:hypothetical protein
MKVLSLIPKEQLDRVLNQAECDIDTEFLGFTDIYEHLAEIIPMHFRVIDLGCAYAPQCFYFTLHMDYTGVDSGNMERFSAHNTSHLTKSIQDFIAQDLDDYDLDETFAICSYVPDFEAQTLVRATFPNLFVFYPSDKRMSAKFASQLTEAKYAYQP